MHLARNVGPAWLPVKVRHRLRYYPVALDVVLDDLRSKPSTDAADWRIAGSATTLDPAAEAV